MIPVRNSDLQKGTKSTGYCKYMDKYFKNKYCTFWFLKIYILVIE